jgi:hypothetical protein
MPNESYDKLRDFLDQFSIGFPSTDSGVELKILKRLFSEEEAEITIQLSPFPEEAPVIAARIGVPAEQLSSKLEAMAQIGLITPFQYLQLLPLLLCLHERHHHRRSEPAEIHERAV